MELNGTVSRELTEVTWKGVCRVALEMSCCRATVMDLKRRHCIAVHGTEEVRKEKKKERFLYVASSKALSRFSSL